MRPLILILSALLPATLAFPGMEQLLRDLQLHHRQAGSEANHTETCGGRGGGPNAGEPGEGEFDSVELIGDLLTLSDAELSPVGRSVKAIILGRECPESDATWAGGVVPALGTEACRADTCCVWQYIADDMMRVFRGRSGRCTGLARAAIRLGFHDAGGFSKATAPGGGADGSIILAPEEMQRPDNNGLQDIVAHMQAWHNKWTADPTSYSYSPSSSSSSSPPGTGGTGGPVSMADLIQFGAVLAVASCPLGPRIRTFVGRADNASAAPPGLLPPVAGSADLLVELFRNKTIAPHGLAALVGAHTTSQQFFVDESRAGDPQDSTPGVWDVLFYRQALGGEGVEVPPRVFMFDSDVVLGRDSRTGPEMALFGFASDGQADWNEDYAREYTRLSMLSVYQINNMTECTKVLPPAITNFTEPDQDYVDIWRATDVGLPDVANELFNGSLVSAKDFQNVSSTGE